MSSRFPQYRHPPRTGYNRFKAGTWQAGLRKVGDAECMACGAQWEANVAVEHTGCVTCPECGEAAGVFLLRGEIAFREQYRGETAD